MNQKKIMQALRQLVEAVKDEDGRSDKALEIVDATSSKLSKLYDYDFKEGESVYGDPPDTTHSAMVSHVIELVKVEIYFLGANNDWSSDIVGIPEHVAKTESQDAFSKWLYTPEGEVVSSMWSEWAGDVIAAFVLSWRDDLKDSGWSDDYIVHFTRSEDGRWKAWGHLNYDNDQDTADVFDTWDAGKRAITIDNDEADYRIYTTEEAELHLKRLEALKSSYPEIKAEIEELKRASAISIDPDLLDLENEA